MSEVLTTSSLEVLIVPSVTSETLEVSEQEVLTINEGTIELLEVAEQGPPGMPGSAEFYTYPANGAVSGHRVIRISSGMATVCTTSDDLYAHNFVGVSMNAATNGDPVNIQRSGEMVEPTWSWAEDKPIFMGSDGRLTQVANPSGLSVIVATVLTPTKIIIDIRQPIVTI